MGQAQGIYLYQRALNKTRANRSDWIVDMTTSSQCNYLPAHLYLIEFFCRQNNPGKVEFHLNQVQKIENQR